VRVRGTWLAPASDAAIAAAAVLASYWLRFDADALPSFLVSGQRAALLAAVLLPITAGVLGVYTHPPRRLWPVRLMAAAALSQAAAAAAVWLIFGFDRVSRFAFLASALLTIFGCGAWRAAEGLAALRGRRAASAAGGMFEERGVAAPSLGVGVLKLLGYRELIRNLVVKDLKLKYRGSALGFIWSLANPLIMLAVYWMAFTYILGMRRPGFVFFLMLGLLAWSFFAGTTSMSAGSVADNGGLLRSVRFPRLVLPVATVLFNLAQYLLTFIVLLPVMMLIFRIPLSWAMVSYPLILALLVFFTTGVALIVSVATVLFRDVKHLVEVALSVLFWLTPIIYDLNDVPERLRLPLLLSPMTPFVTAMHDVFYHQAWPAMTVWTAATAWSVVMFLIGFTLFITFEERLAEHL
jgi:ABC-2 type transport system permease protein